MSKMFPEHVSIRELVRYSLGLLSSKKEAEFDKMKEKYIGFKIELSDVKNLLDTGRNENEIVNMLEESRKKTHEKAVYCFNEINHHYGVRRLLLGTN